MCWKGVNRRRAKPREPLSDNGRSEFDSFREVCFRAAFFSPRIPRNQRLGLNWNLVTLTTCCQVYVKTGLYSLMLFFPSALVALVGGAAVQWVFGKRPIPMAVHFIPLVLAAAAVVGTVMLLAQPDLMEYMLPTRMWLDANHFPVAVAVMLAGVVALLWELRQYLADHGQGRSSPGTITLWVLVLSLAVAAASGLLVFLKIPALDTVTRVSYTLFDAAIAVLMAGVIVTVVHRVVQQLRANGADQSAEPSESA
jgi:hypothetical protein